MALIDVLSDIVEHAREYASWRGEWDRTSNPVAFWLAVSALMAILLIGGVWLYAGWERLQNSARLDGAGYHLSAGEAASIDAPSSMALKLPSAGVVGTCVHFKNALAA